MSEVTTLTLATDDGGRPVVLTAGRAGSPADVAAEMGDGFADGSLYASFADGGALYLKADGRWENVTL